MESILATRGGRASTQVVMPQGRARGKGNDGRRGWGGGKNATGPCGCCLPRGPSTFRMSPDYKLSTPIFLTWDFHTVSGSHFGRTAGALT